MKNIEKLDLIKLDIEGFEMDVLNDIHNIKKDLPVIIFEIWNNEFTNKDTHMNRLDFENLIKSLNYKYIV